MTTLAPILAAALIGALIGRAVWGLADGGPVIGVEIGGAWLRLGWGYDDDLPLRPWPAIRRNRMLSSALDLCAAWCGFYVGLRWPTVPR